VVVEVRSLLLFMTVTSGKLLGNGYRECEKKRLLILHLMMMMMMIISKDFEKRIINGRN
jgi:hypothetical protein